MEKKYNQLRRMAINYGICCLICGQLLKVNEILRFKLLTYIKRLNDINQIPFFLCYYMIRFIEQKKESEKASKANRFAPDKLGRRKINGCKKKGKKNVEETEYSNIPHNAVAASAISI